MKTDRYFLAVHKALNLTFKRYTKSQEFFANDWQKFWNASQKDLFQSGIDKKGCEKFLENRKHISPEKIQETLLKKEISVLPYFSDEYPWQLKNIYNPPMALFCRGRFESSDFPSLGVVGSRGITSYGKKVLRNILPEIARSGLSITSGLAFGVDILAHTIAVESGARTIAVLGNAIDTVYPALHARLVDDFVAQDKGVVVSEYFPGTETRPEFFPARNRIIAGLSKALLVVEAGEKSGSLITAHQAFESGREVLAVPGDIFSKMSRGTNELLHKGIAAPALSGKSVLQSLGISLENHVRPKSLPENPEESHLLELFLKNQNMLHIDDIFRLSSLEKTRISSLLSFLELKGRIRSIGANKYVLHG